MTTRTFEMTCSRMGLTILILVVFPLVIAGSMIAVIIPFANSMPDWALLVIIFLILLLTAYMLIGFLKKWGTAPCTVEIDDKGIKVALKKKSVFYPGTVFQSSWADLKSASTGYEPQRNEHFYKVQFSSPDLTIYLNSPEKVNDASEETEFGSLFLAYVALQNSDFEKKGKQQIDTKNFYQSRWAKVITYMLWILLLAGFAAGYFYPETFDTWKIVRLSVCSGIWFVAYYANTLKKKRT